MADSCYMNLESEVFDDQIVPDTDDCFLPPSEPQLASHSHVSIILHNSKWWFFFKQLNT